MESRSAIFDKFNIHFVCKKLLLLYCVILCKTRQDKLTIFTRLLYQQIEKMRHMELDRGNNFAEPRYGDVPVLLSARI